MVGFFMHSPYDTTSEEGGRMDKVAVFIDGSNFYNKLKELGIRREAQVR